MTNVLAYYIQTKITLVKIVAYFETIFFILDLVYPSILFSAIPCLFVWGVGYLMGDDLKLICAESSALS